MLSTIILYNILLPSVIAGSIFLVAWKLKKSGISNGRWGAGLAIMLGYCAGNIALTSAPVFPPPDPSTGWFIYVAGAAFLLSLLESAFLKKAWLYLPLRFMLIGAASWVILKPLIQYGWDFQGSIFRVVIIGLIAVFNWNSFDKLAKFDSKWVFSILLIEFSTLISITILLSHSILLAQLQGVLTAAIGAVAVLKWLLPDSHLEPTGTALISTIAATHIISALFYADMHIASVLLFIAAPASCLLVWHKLDTFKGKLYGLATSIIMQVAAVIVN